MARLRAAGCVFAEEEADLLLAEARPAEELAAMVRQRESGLPLEQILGWAEFCGLRIAVEPGVFVPRKRTEFLVHQAIALAPAGAVVVDLCCGTGALAAAVAAALRDSGRAADGPAALHGPAAQGAALRGSATDGRAALRGSAAEGAALRGPAAEGSALRGPAAEGAALRGPAAEGAALRGSAAEGAALRGPAAEGSALRGLAAGGGVEVFAADVDPAAVRCARRNVPGPVYRGDLYEALPLELKGRIDVLIANAPYVPSGEVGLMPPEARVYEPPVALDGGADGLDVLRRVIAGAPDWLAADGHLLVESSERQAPQLVEAALRHGLRAQITTAEDLGATAVVAELVR
ncbi:hypothetical protein Rhe02_45340 [Rhizocola hellebori]|uniref:Methyltransferase small domain-containing protein n=1 Tax=Rhizocola hellebori TaxID=1392758 RepID=A0A8J3QAV4_9ACTN|nr:hypothetical protein Rhe02_45340 [Rhizocola hellebori]